MRSYFNNPEIKKSSITLLAVMAIFILSSSMVIRANNENLRRDYIRVMGGITAKVIEKAPQLEGEIVPLMTGKLTSEEEAHGIDILRQYGLQESLDVSLFPYIKEGFSSSIFYILILGLALTGLLFLMNYLQHGYFYNNMRDFSSAAKRIVEGDYNLKFGEKSEGDLSKLAQSFNMMGEVIRGNISALRKEKEFLVDLLSDISHQLKTPLSTMILYNDIMLYKELSSQQRETFLKNTQSQLNRMRWLIQSFLKLAKIDANAIELEIEDQSLNETLEEVIETLESKALERRVRIDFIQREDILLMHDRLWLQEALINVVKNGIEHSPEGGNVAIDLEENPVYTRITVKNTGEVISEEDLANIFKRFYKGKNSSKSDSIGIGLSLAKSIIERHGGYIEARSDMDEGTRFIITFLKY
ncbi:MAG: resE8 [Clostridiales bacterium]|jgi:signal transduction histidine kinase|nr:resE8 [Clostridiales bacterium]